MNISALATDERVADVEVTENELSVRLMDGRTISVPLVWYPRLLEASEIQRRKWEIIGGGYGIHWEDIDEDLSTQGLLHGARAPRHSLAVTKSNGHQREDHGSAYKESDNSPFVKASDDDSEKGLLDYLTEGEDATHELTSMISIIDTETRNIAAKFDRHTSNIERLRHKSGGSRASDYKRIALLAASDMNTFSKRVEDVLPRFEKNVQILEESFSGYVSLANSESSDDIEQISILHDSLSQLLTVFTPVKESVIGFRDSTLSIGDEKVSKELNRAVFRQSEALNGVVSHIEQVESFALRLMFLIREKLGHFPTP